MRPYIDFVTALPRTARLAGLLALATIISACAQTGVTTPTPVVVEIAGATSMHPMLEEMATEFTSRHSSIIVVLHGGGSALGEMRVSRGALDLAASTLMQDDAQKSAAPTDEDVAAGADVETGADPLIQMATPNANPATTIDKGEETLQRAPIGIDGIAVVVHDDNPTTDLTAQQLQDLYSGRILDWRELDGFEGEVRLVSREDGSGTRRAFESRVMGDKDVSLTAVVMPTSRDVIDYVSKNPFAIGYVSSAFTHELPAQTDSGNSAAESAGTSHIRVVAIDGVLPTDETIRDQSYPLIQPLYLIRDSSPPQWTRQFIDFALSPAGQAIVDRHHVPIR